MRVVKSENGVGNLVEMNRCEARENIDLAIKEGLMKLRAGRTSTEYLQHKNGM